jgi:hypothetical protein
MQAPVMAMIISVDGNIVIKKIDGDLKSLREEVGGYIELVRLYKGKISMYINEEGKCEGLPVNLVASMIAVQGGLVNDFIVGNVVLLGKGTPDGFETSIDPEFCVKVTNWAIKHKDKLNSSIAALVPKTTN